MAASPFRRRKGASTLRNLAIAEAALALAKDRALGPRSRRRSRRPGRFLLVGGATAVAGAIALVKRDRLARLLPSRTGDSDAASAPAAPMFTPPQPSNYDAPGPVANTATPIPAPDPHGEPPATIDEAAEEASAAAEAAAIGGGPSDYAGPELGEPADEAFRPLAEAGEGESEGLEQAEAELEANATYRDGGMTDAERQIDDTIERADQPLAGETPEPLASHDAGPAAAESDAQQSGDATTHGAPTDDTADDVAGGGISGRPFAGLEDPPAESGAAPSEPAAPEDKPAVEGGDGPAEDSPTWSGRSVDP